MKFLKNKKGFTLVECMVAIAMVTVISATALTIVMNVTKNTNDQWNKYRLSQMEDNAVADFQGSDSFAEFDGHLSELNFSEGKEVSTPATHTTNTVLSKYKQYTPSSEAIPVPFKTIRAYESGKIKFFNVDLDNNKDDYPATNILANFDYTGNTGNYTVDKNLFSNSGIYNPGIVKKEATKKITGIEILPNTSKYKASNTDKSAYVSISYSVNDAGAVNFHLGYSADDKNYTGVLKPFEKYLFDNNIILGFANNKIASGTGGGDLIQEDKGDKGGYLYFYMYKIKENKDASGNVTYSLERGCDLGNTLRVTYPKGQFSLGSTRAGNSYWDVNEEITVSKVEVGNVPSGKKVQDSDITYNELVGKNDEGENVTYKNFEWGGLPLFASYCAGPTFGESCRVTPHFDDINGFVLNPTTITVEGNVIYTDYTLKTGHKSEIHYVMSDKESNILLYNDAEMLYGYTAANSEDTVSKIDSEVKGKLKLDEGEVQTVDGKEYTKYLKTVGTTKITKVTFDNTNRKIIFKDAASKSVIEFTYGSTAEEISNFTQDKNYITASDGAYKKFYTRVSDTEYTVNVTGKFSLRGESKDNMKYVQITINHDGKDDVIFSAYTDGIKVDGTEIPGDSFAEKEEKISSTDALLSSKTKYYTYSVGNYGCVIKVTYSDYTADSNTEPMIKIWNMSSADCVNWSNSGTLADPAGAADVYYRKG